MRKQLFQCAQHMACAALFCAQVYAQNPSSWVFVGSDGKLHYKTDANGNQILDFSSAGYQAGGVALPSVGVAQTVTPISGDNTAQIQAAINSVAALTPDANGIRGAVLLRPGTYDVSGTLNLNVGGVVVEGSGSGSGGTILNMTGAPHLMFSAGGSGSWSTTGPAVNMTDSYVPSGATSFDVSDASSFHVGNTILINRPVTTAWIHFMGMDTLMRNGAPQTWIPAGTIIETDRVITAINGNRITIDTPLADDFDSTLLQGSIVQYTFPTRVSQIGIEHLQVVAPAVNVVITSPQFTGITMSALIDSWMQDVAFQDTQNTVGINNTAKRITLDNVHVSHTVIHTGDRMADFGVNGTQIFVNQSSSNGNGEWPMLTQGKATGPVAVLNFNSTQLAGIGPHQRWAVGLLCDDCSLPDAPDNPDGGATGVFYGDRGDAGSGQGWAMGWGVAWNATTPFLVVQQPPGALNWCIGCIGSEVTAKEPGSGKVIPNGVFESLGAHVTPESLYLAQLCARLGPAALSNIGYAISNCVTTVPPATSYEAEAPSNTIAGAARVASCSSCSGGEKVGFIGNGPANFVTFNNVRATLAGNHTLTVFCLVKGSRSFSVSVNGGAAQTVSCTGTTFSVPVSNPPSITVNLNAGSNTIKFFNDTAFAPDLDRITVL
jgi:hypothetical protein